MFIGSRHRHKEEQGAPRAVLTNLTECKLKICFLLTIINSHESGIILLNLTIRFVPERPCDFEVKMI